MAGTDPQRFGPYIILDRIGDGGMAEIFLAKMQGYSGFEKLIALKRILPRYSQNRTFAQMLIHEAKLAAALQHFNVVQVLDLGEIDRQVFIAMEYVRGRDLAAVLSNTYRRKEKLPLPLTLCIATEFMTGLDYAHRVRSSEGQPLGIIHRDISPQNILISYEGEVKVTDFGIARVAENEGFQLPGNLHGKFGYMSPEQVLGQEIDQRSDIFSAGVVLYEMLTGQRLFRGREHKDTIKMIVSHVIPPPSAVNPEVPPSVDRICAKSLARDRNLRYQTMGALLGELSRVADTLPRRAATRDLSVYMRRQFGNAAASVGPPKPKREVSQVSGVGPGEFRGRSSVSDLPTNPGASQSGRKTPIGTILIDQGAIKPSDLDLALAEQRARGGRIGELLIASGSISDEDLLRALSTQSGLPTISQDDSTSLTPPPKLLARFPREAAEATLMLPISVDEKERSVRLAVSDPYDDRAILETKVVLGVSDVVVFLAKRTAIRTAIARWYDAEADADAAREEAEPIFSEAREVEPQRPIVLIADGDRALVEKLVERVREEDCEVFTATDGKAARQICREKKVVVAFLDAALPGIDGYNLLLELRSKSSDAAVFITPARGDEERQAKALELGADDFLVKPLPLELTTSKIRREIQKRSTGRKVTAQPVHFSGVSGSLKDMPTLDIVQSLELGKKSAHVVIQYSDGRSGELATRSGDLRGCVAGSLLGEEAFYLLARPADGLFRIEYRESPVPSNITKPNTFLMIEAMRRLDESDHAAAQPGPQVATAPVAWPEGILEIEVDLAPRRPSSIVAPHPLPAHASAPHASAPHASAPHASAPPRAASSPIPGPTSSSGVHPSFIEASPVDALELLGPPERSSEPQSWSAFAPSELDRPPPGASLPPWSTYPPISKAEAAASPLSPEGLPDPSALQPWNAIAPTPSAPRRLMVPTPKGTPLEALPRPNPAATTVDLRPPTRQPAASTDTAAKGPPRPLARILPTPPLGPLTTLAPLGSIAPAASRSTTEISSGWDDGLAAWDHVDTAAPTQPGGTPPKRPPPKKPTESTEPTVVSRPLDSLADDLTLDHPTAPNRPASRRDPFFTPSAKPGPSDEGGNER